MRFNAGENFWDGRYLRSVSPSSSGTIDTINWYFSLCLSDVSPNAEVSTLLWFLRNSPAASKTRSFSAAEAGYVKMLCTKNLKLAQLFSSLTTSLEEASKSSLLIIPRHLDIFLFIFEFSPLCLVPLGSDSRSNYIQID